MIYITSLKVLGWQVSATGLVIGCLITAVSFYLKAHDMAHEAVPVLAVSGILVGNQV